MRVDDLFPPEVIDEDVRKTLAGVGLGAAIAFAPFSQLGREGPMPTYSQEEVNILAKTIWAEARNQGEVGMAAVGHVIKNRAEAGKPKLYGSGIKGVVTKPYQFSCWNPGDPSASRLGKMEEIEDALANKTAPGDGDYDKWYATFKQSSLYKDFLAWQKAKNLAQQILLGHSPDPTDGAEYYHTTRVHPSWADKLQPVAKLADHIFYKNEPRKT